MSIRGGYKLYSLNMKLQYIIFYLTSNVLSQRRERKRAKGRNFSQDSLIDVDYSAMFAAPSGSMLEQMIAMSMGNNNNARPPRKNREKKKKKSSVAAEGAISPGKCSKFKYDKR